MMKPKTKTSPVRWKRKRACIVERRLRDGPRAIPKLGDARRVVSLAQKSILPVLLAQTARRLGAPGIAPKDFYCGCAPCVVDGAPICEGLRCDCHHAGRWTPEAAQNRETDAAVSRYLYNWELTMFAYQGKRIASVFDDASPRVNTK